MQMVDFLIKRPVAVIMVFVALVLLGVISINQIPVSPMPDIDIPEVTIHINKPNTSSKELESTVVSNLRTQLLQVPYLSDIHSNTRDDNSTLRLRFDYGTNLDYAFIEVNEKIDLSMNSFPVGMERPRVVKTSVNDIPVFYLNLSFKTGTVSEDSPSYTELSDFTRQIIKRRLEQLPEIAYVDITGLSHSEIYISPDPAIMAAINLTDESLKKIIEGNNFNYRQLSAMDGALLYDIRLTSGSLVTLNDIKNINFKHNERIFKLKDVADIGFRTSPVKGCFISNSQPAINLAIIKKPDAQMGNLRSNLGALLVDFARDYPDIHFRQTQDQTELLDISISSLKQDLLVGSFLAFALMFFFLKNLRAPLLIGITIPVCLILCMLLFQIFHLSINIISLSGLVLGIGLMIDNSIIVIDNITQFREKNMNLSDACAQGTGEVIRPLLSSALTTCSVFVPLIFLSGISGELFYDQAMAIAIGLMVSLIVSITLLPTLYHLFHQGKVSQIEIDFFKKYEITLFEQIYEKGFHWVFRNKIFSLSIVSILIISNIFLFANLKKEKLPAFKQNELRTDIDWNRNISIEENKERVLLLLKSFNGEVIESNVMIGEQQYMLNKESELSSSQAQLYLKLKDTVSITGLKRKINHYFRNKYPEASVSLAPPSNIFEKVLGDDQPDLVIRLTSLTNEDVPEKRKTDQLMQAINQQFPESDITPVAIQRTLALNADPEKLLLYGLSLEEVYKRLKSGLNSNEISILRNGEQQIPIVVANNVRFLDDALNGLTVINDKGLPIPLSGLLNVTSETTYKAIEGGKHGNFISLRMDAEKPEEVINYVNGQLESQENIDVSFSGSFFYNEELIKEMTIVLIVAVFLLYFILSAQFESLIQPLIVLLELPISMSGALIMLYIFDSSINLISLIGLIVMCGIIINDSILKIDTVNQLRRNRGYNLMDAIHIGGKKRPMTSPVP